MMKTHNIKSLKKLVLAALVASPFAVTSTAWAQGITVYDVGTINAADAQTATNQATLGSATIAQTATAAGQANVVTIVPSDKAVLTWQDFDIGANDSVAFNFATAGGAVLNRVIGAAAVSNINGTLTSNGKVFVQNPNGIVIGGTAVINVQEFMASTRNESSGYFVANGTLSLTGNTTADTDVLTGAALTGNITLVGEESDVAGTVTGNLTVKTTTEFAVGTGIVQLGVGGILSVSGNLDVQSGGGAVDLSNSANAVTVAGNVSVATAHTLSTSAAGAVSQTAGSFVANTVGKTVTINARSGGTGAHGAVTLGGGGTFDAKSLSASGAAVSITEAAGSADLDVTGVTASGAVTILSNANTASSGSDLLVSGAVSGSSVAITSAANNLTVSGNITTSAGAAATTATAGNLTVSGNVTTTGGGFTLDADKAVSLTGTSTIAGGNFTVDGLVGAAEDSLSVTGNVTVAGADAIIQNLSSISLTGTISATGAAGDIVLARTSATTGTLTAGNNLSAGGDLTITNNNGNITLGNLTVGDDLTVATTATGGNISMIGSSVSDVTDDTSLSVAGAASTITYAGGASKQVELIALTTAGGSATITSGKAITLNVGAAITVPTVSLTTTVGDVDMGNTPFTGATALTINAAANAKLNTVTTATATVATTNGTVTQPAGLITATTLNVNAGGATGKITLGAANAVTNVKLEGGAAGTDTARNTYVDADGFVVLTGTNMTGSSALTAGLNGNIVLGAAAANTITFANTTFTTSGTGTITDGGLKNLTIGDVTFTTAGQAVTLDYDGATFADVNYAFGKITVAAGAGNVTVFEKADMSIGAVTGANIALRSVTAGITQDTTTAVTATGTTNFNAATDVSLASATNNFGAGVMTLNAVNATVREGGASDLAVTGAGTKVTGTAAFTMANDALTLNGDFATVSYSGSGTNGAAGTEADVTITDTAGDLTLKSFAYTGAAADQGDLAVTVNVGNLVFDTGVDLSKNNTAASAFTTVTAAKTITQTAAITVGAPVTFTSNNGAITLTTSGNTFGTLTLSNGGTAAAMSVTELNDLAFAAITGGTGAVTLISENGNITDAAGAVATGAFTLKAGEVDGTGSITLNDVGGGDTVNSTDVTMTSKGTTGDISVIRGGGAITGNVTVSAGRDFTGTLAATGATKTATFTTGRNLTLNAGSTIAGTINVVSANNVSFDNGAVAMKLGNFTRVTGTLGITTAGAAVTLQADKSMIIIGDTTITTAGGAVDLTAVAGAGTTARGTIATGIYNNFGGVTINSGAGNISIDEGNTLRLMGLTSTGTVVAESQWGSIIDTNPSTLTGSVTFVTTQGAITLDHHNNEFRTVKAITDLFDGTDGAPSNATLGNVYLATKNTGAGNFDIVGGTKVGGTYTLVGDATVVGTVSDSGTVKINGDVTLDVQSAGITLDDNVSTFGGIQFKAGAAGVDIYENAATRIRGGSSSTGNVKVSSFGAISFTTDLNCNFAGNVEFITFGAGNTVTIPNTVYMTGAAKTLTLNTASGAEKKLGALSAGINLNGNTVIYVGGSPATGDQPGL